MNKIRYFVVLIAVYLENKGTQGLIPKDRTAKLLETGRRDVLATSFVTIGSVFLAGGGSASAFENKISNKYDDRPKRRGPKVSWTFFVQ